ncbi:transcriptional repressor LexA [Gluconobacter wancherniae]|uniref:LexA repressor n=1 Tax=Gluconobacter wancherniae NBRC 103581 TaxID=656744 RepID=A0A511B191_9PROT|nr:transcriptional repressor LexA [Gluconobacter wancherniae]MBF0853411.1 transcriptional repressor LexA [Gluconobacter wancherniae]MBS1063356.1 transcriptional repressor LexA [Gluconobacter wancherniae]MBS1088225.1 transcriptional repressor LexA [Gluconobacter wancherniae]GBD55856.1 LexA repressor [Gluconobacter wancherniae NBRC 103581]GBR66005.1 LexA repressor [Gluconobacter wancherniae NBRC 103581]
MLTRKQHQLLLYIDDHLRRTGFSPSFDEMKDALGLRSKSGIHRLISALEEREFLRRHHHRARALEVLRLPHMGTGAETSTAEFSPAVLSGKDMAFEGKFAEAENENEAAPRSISLPLYGRIAAGLPIEALREQGSQIDVPVSLLTNGEHYALTVTGDSMIEAGILDGDTAIIRQGELAENGQIVVALIDNQEVTLKRLRRKGAMVALEAANPEYETRILPADRVRIQGRLVGLYRHY